MHPSELINLYSQLRIAASKKTNSSSLLWSVWKKNYKVVVGKLFQLEPSYTVDVLERTLDEYKQKLALAQKVIEPRTRKKTKRQKTKSIYVGCKADLKNANMLLEKQNSKSN